MSDLPPLAPGPAALAAPLQPRETTLSHLRAAERAAARLSAQGPDAPARAALQEALAAIRRELERPPGAGMATAAAGLEIERKYLLRELPALLAGRPARLLEQGYLPGTRLLERLRRVRDLDGRERYWRTIKDGTGVVRLELEEETEAGLFAALWPLTVGRRVSKERHAVPHGALVWEVDRFTDRELVLAEVELPDAAMQPEAPAWLAPYVVREVTGEGAYVNANLAR